MLKHGGHEVFSCQVCNYRTGRKDNFTRHMKQKHSSWKMISSLVVDIISQVHIETAARDANEQDEVVEDNLSDYERARNIRVAEMQAEFQRRFPTFEAEVQELRVRKKKRRGVRKPAAPAPARRTSRGLIGDVRESVGDELNEESPVAEAGLDHQPGDEGVSQEVDDEEAGETGSAGDMGQSANGRFGCVPCGLSFRDTGNMRRHVRLLHEPRKDPVTCPRIGCKAVFSIMADMLKHKDICVMTCPYPGCVKTFKKKVKFDSHQRGHKIFADRMMD